MEKYRVGKRTGRAILEVATGHEFLVFPVQAKEERVKEYCDYLNSLPENRDYSFRCNGEYNGNGRCTYQCKFCQIKGR